MTLTQWVPIHEVPIHEVPIMGGGHGPGLRPELGRSGVYAVEEPLQPLQLARWQAENRVKVVSGAALRVCAGYTSIWGIRTRKQLLRFCLPREQFSSFPSGKRCCGAPRKWPPRMARAEPCIT